MFGGKLLFCASLVAGLGLGAVGTASAENFITIGTGGVTGVYYPTMGQSAVWSTRAQGARRPLLRRVDRRFGL